MQYTRYADLTWETERLHIRAWRQQDAEEAFEMYGDPQVAEFLTGVAEESVASQREILVKIIAAYSQLDIGMGSFPLIEKNSGQLVGAILLKPLPRTEHYDAWRNFRDNPLAIPPIHEIEIGWHLKRSCWGKGFATEAARQLMAYGFETLELQEIYAILYPANKKSAAITTRLGMDRIGETDRFYGIVADLYKRVRT